MQIRYQDVQKTSPTFACNFYSWKKILFIGNDIEFLDSIKGYLKEVFQIKTSVKLLTYWASRSRSRRLTRFFNDYIAWQDFEVVQNGTVKEGVLAYVARCEVE